MKSLRRIQVENRHSEWGTSYSSSLWSSYVTAAGERIQTLAGGIQKSKCKYCGQWGESRSECGYCGAPVDVEEKSSASRSVKTTWVDGGVIFETVENE